MAREFWITDDGDAFFDCVVSVKPTYANSLRVIEYSAYEALRVENELLKQKLTELQF